ncbi:CD48 antigen [Hyaena hyaena]|uniref:CD48 antigen n=1 Tax=Hyaena hyaena TaxID=95912 RepID=UPI001920C329|nr:CD48 antigen [Hyaena hyaena]
MRSQRQAWFTALGFLLLFRLLLAKVQDPSNQVIAISGSNVTLKIYNLSDEFKQLTWFYNDNQKIAEWEAGEIIYFKSRFKDRVILGKDYELYIYNIQKEDSSKYILLELKESGIEVPHHISLTVLDPVPKPFIKIEKREEVNNSCHLKLLCEISDDRSVNYTWYGDLEAFPTAFHSNVLEITINPQKYSGSYTCQISNAVSSKNDTIYFTLPCTLSRSSGVSWIATWLVVIIPIVPALLWT